MSRISDEKLWSWVDREAPELDRHLVLHPDDSDRVNEIRRAMGRAAAAFENGQAVHSVFRVPERIGAYRIDRLLGEGGMGVVYSAHQDSPKRDVALKLIRNVNLADDNRLERFRREADALARLTHPSIATIYELGESDEGTPYIAMELVRGRALDLHVRERNLKRRERLELFRTICDAVHHAHTHGVIHRDLKPANILVDRDGVPRILDFGLAHIGDSEHSHLVTEPGHVLGTLAYMSPEQVRAVRSELTAQTDVYSLGVLLYELLTDRLPHELADTSLPEAARRICELPPKRPSKFDRRLKGELETIVLKALEKDLSQRYQNAQELAEDLRRHLAGEPIRAQWPSSSYRLRKFIGRHKLATMFLFVTTILGTFSAYGFFTMNSELFGGIGGDGFPTISPFEAVRFRGSVPEVQVDGRWFELVSIDGTRAGLMVENVRHLEPHGWKKRFTEDLWEAMFRMGHFPGFRVNLVLRDLETRALVTKSKVLMTTINRGKVWNYRNNNPIADMQYREGLVLTAIGNAPDGRVVFAGGLKIEPLATYASAHGLPLSAVLSEILTEFEDHTPDRDVVIILENQSGERSEVTAPLDSADLNSPLLPEDDRRDLWQRARVR